jgi:SseB protein N-terminal domain
MMKLTAGDERFRGDHGEADPAVAAAFRAYVAGTGGEHALLTALAGSRLLVPVVAVLADGGGEAPDGRVAGQAGLSQGEKASEMAMPAIVGRDGRRALPAFTSAAAVRRWQPAARPVPVPASGVWQSAAHESWAVVIDIAEPVPVVVEGARLAALAAGAQPPAMHADPDVWQQVAAAAAEIAPGIRIRLSPAPEGLDFTLELAPPAGAAGPVPDEAASQIATGATARLGGRVRAGIAVIVRPPE